MVEFGDQFKGSHKLAEMFTGKIPAVIIRNDSIIVTGDKLLQTFDRLEVAEFSARSLIMGYPLGELVAINNEQIEALRKKFLA